MNNQTTFKKVPSSASSISKRKLVFGVGINDANYVVQPTVNGKQVACPVYKRWKHMLGRCYSNKVHTERPTYKGCSVAKEWLTFSNFASWYKENHVDDYDLDKDIQVKGNKAYSSEMCLFVPRCINGLLTDRKAARGEYPQGVSFHRSSGKYRARVAIDSKEVMIGLFPTPGLASKAYVKAKNNEIRKKCEQYPEFAEYLINHLLDGGVTQ